jgi:DNA-directed RNA polymerase specialized sigma24 family protein
MSEVEQLLTDEERSALLAIANQEGVNGQRAKGLLALSAGLSQAEAAEQTGLSKGQISYALRRFREQKLGMFAPAEGEEAPEEPQPAEDQAQAEAVGENPAGVYLSAAQFHQIMNELNTLADKLRAQVPNYTPPPFSPEELLRLLKENMHQFTPEMKLDVLRDLQANLPNVPTAQEFLDPETWRGMWFILTYTVQNESKNLFQKTTEQIVRLPGVNFGLSTSKKLFGMMPGSELVVNLAGMLEGSSPKDFLDPETWKGMMYLVNHSLQYELSQLKTRVIGSEEEEEEEGEEE